MVIRYLRAIVGLLLLFAVLGLQHLSVTPDTRYFFSANDPRLAELFSFEDRFRKSNSLIFVISCINDCVSVDTLIEDLTDLVNDIPSVVDVQSLSNTPILTSTDEAIETQSYLAHYCSKTCNLSDLSSIDDPHVLDRLINRTGTATAVFANVSLDMNSSHQVADVTSAARAIVDKFAHSGYEFHIIGGIPLMQAFVDATNSEVTGHMGLAIALILILLVLAFGNFKLALIISSLSVMTVLATLGTAGWAGFVVSTATASIPVILFTLVVAMSMHYFMHVVRVVNEDHKRDLQSIANAALYANLTPTILTASTTIVCMLSLLTIESPPISELGLWLSVGVGIGCTLLFLYAPPIVSSLGRIKASSWQSFLQERLNNYAKSIERKVSASLVMLGLVVVSIASIASLEVDDDFVRYFSKGTEFRDSVETVSNLLFGSTSVEIVIDSGRADGVFDPGFLRDVQSLMNYLRNRPEVDSVASYYDHLRLLNEHLGNGIDLHTLDSASVSQLFFAFELAMEDGQSVSDLVDDHKQSARISVLLTTLTASELRRFEKEIESQWGTLSANDYNLIVTGEAIPMAYLSIENLPGMMGSILLAFVLTSIVLGGLFRNWRISVVALFTTVIPVLCGFGIWGAFTSTIGLAAAVVVAVCMGVVIDDSIHLIYRFFYGLRKIGLDPSEAAAFAVHRVGSAIVTTTVVLTIGFGVLGFSPFEVNRTFGICSALILGIALLIDLLMLPSLLVWAAEQSTSSKNNRNAENRRA